jgi:hypothetical protein
VKKISIGLCALALCLLTACLDFCGFKEGKARTTYTWSYTDSDGQTHSGEFTTNEYGQGSFDTPTSVDCSKVSIGEKKTPEIAMEESAV